MRGLAAYDRAVAAIDAANHDDPRAVDVRGASWPLAEIHGRLAADWVTRLVPAPDESLLLAARAHHLRRWELPRASYPQGRRGYLRWRGEQKARHARDVGALLVAAGYPEAIVARVQALVRRDGLATGDPGAQAVEDAACLVFLETQLAEDAGRLEPEVLGNAVRKTVAKMSPAAAALIAEVPLDEATRASLAEALR